MSIAIVGQQKYEVQDWATLAFALRFYDHIKAVMDVEPKGGEDFELRAHPAAELMEVQAKAADGQVDLGTLCAVLAHSGRSIAANMLVERLLAGGRYAVLVASGRCDDATSKFARRLEDDLDSPRALPTVKEARTFLAAFGMAQVEGKPGGALHSSRVKRVAEVAAGADIHQIRHALSRVSIIENQRQPDLQQYVSAKLRALGIAGDVIGDLERRLLEIIRRSKGTGADVLIELREEIERARPDPLRPPRYIGRGDEASLGSELATRRVLLLSGRPRVGKSWLARYIGASLQTEGFAVREAFDPEDAERFLADPGGKARAVVLDDPLGAEYPVAAPAREHARITRLIGRLRTDRRLIVAQGSERLLETTQRQKLADVVTGSASWHDVGLLAGDFLARLWQELCKEFEVPGWLAGRVADAITAGERAIEAGCLHYLAATHVSLAEDANIDAIFRHAREDVTSIAQTLAREGHGAVLAGLAVATRPHGPISEQTLAFVLGSGGSTLPGKARGFTVITIPAPDPDATEPVYDTPPVLDDAQRRSLEVLRRRGMISASTSQIAFSHPIYRAAAEHLVEEGADLGLVMDMAERSLLSLSPATSRATAGNLQWLLELFRDADGQRRLVDLAEAGLLALYPGTRDACYRFLMRHVAELPAERRDLDAWIGAVRSVDLDMLTWMEGEAVLPASDMGTDWIFRGMEPVARAQVQRELDLLVSEESVTPEQATTALSYLASKPGELTEYAMARLLSFDEGVIRAEAVKAWLGQDRENDKDLLERIFHDEHPLVALAAFRAVVDAWHRVGEERREGLADGLVRLANDPGCAAALLDRLVVFERDHSPEGPPWPLFARLMPEVIRSYPEQVSLVAERFFNVLREAMKVISPQDMLGMCDAWQHLIERRLRSGKLGNDSMLGIASILIGATRDQPELRGERLEGLLRLQGTGVAVRLLADLIDDWDSLRSDEKQLVLTRLTEGREDQIWLRAVALSRSVVPVDITDAVLEPGFILDRGAAELVTSLPADLLAAIVHVHVGTQPFWYLGLQYGAGERWGPVLDYIARDPAHPLFELAVVEVLRRARAQEVVDLLRHLGAEQADRMLQLMLEVKSGCTGNFMPVAWTALLSLAPDETVRDKWLDRMAEDAWLILDYLYNVREWLTDSADRDKLARRLPVDTATTLMIANISRIGAPDGGVMAELIASVELFAERVIGKASLHGTYSDLAALLRDHGSVDAALTERLLGERDRILDARKDRRPIDEDIRSHWISP